MKSLLSLLAMVSWGTNRCEASAANKIDSKKLLVWGRGQKVMTSTFLVGQNANQKINQQTNQQENKRTAQQSSQQTLQQTSSHAEISKGVYANA